MGRVLGIDFGTKRIGLAISDEGQTLARELAILSPPEFFKQIMQLIIDEDISLIVLGWPLNMSGEETKKTKEVAEFQDKLHDLTGLPIEIMDERLSSVMTDSLPGGHQNKDSLAAQIILQNHLDKQKIV